MAEVKNKKTYTKIGYGRVFKNIKHTAGSNLPMFTGPATVNDEEVSVAMWRKDDHGKEGFTLQFTRED